MSIYTISRYFKFGDGEKYQSRICINFPGKLGNKNIRTEADIVDADILLLFSKDSMKKAGMSVNFMTDTITFQGQELHLTVTKSSRYISPITRDMHALQVCDTLIHVMLSTKSSSMTKKDMAAKLHCQFAHAPVECVISLLKKAGDPWNNDSDLFSELKTHADNCDTCARYRKAPPQPIVGLPLATRFLECVSFDLKFILSTIIIHFIDQATRLSAAAIKIQKPSLLLS